MAPVKRATIPSDAISQEVGEWEEPPSVIGQSCPTADDGVAGGGGRRWRGLGSICVQVITVTLYTGDLNYGRRMS